MINLLLEAILVGRKDDVENLLSTRKIDVNEPLTQKELRMLKIPRSIRNISLSKIKGKMSTTILHLAVAANQAEIVSLLLSAGSKVDAVDNEDETPIFEARSVKAAEILMNNGAEINIKDKKDQTPLEHSIINQLYKVIRYLLSVGAGVKHGKMSTLHLAVITNDIEIVSIILGADSVKINEKNTLGLTPLDFAMNAQMARLLKAHGGRRKRTTKREAIRFYTPISDEERALRQRYSY